MRASFLIEYNITKTSEYKIEYNITKTSEYVIMEEIPDNSFLKNVTEFDEKHINFIYETL